MFVGFPKTEKPQKIALLQTSNNETLSIYEEHESEGEGHAPGLKAKPVTQVPITEFDSTVYRTDPLK